jgi:hypothetical protein
MLYFRIFGKNNWKMKRSRKIERNTKEEKAPGF